MKHFDDVLTAPKIKEILAASKLNDIVHKKEDPIEKKKHTFVFFLAIIGAIAAVALIAHLVYRFTTPDYLEDFDDDFDDDFDFTSETTAATDETVKAE